MPLLKILEYWIGIAKTLCPKFDKNESKSLIKYLISKRSMIALLPLKPTPEVWPRKFLVIALSPIINLSKISEKSVWQKWVKSQLQNSTQTSNEKKIINFMCVGKFSLIQNWNHFCDFD